MLSAAAGLSSVAPDAIIRDMVVDIVKIDNCDFARLVGGNTSKDSNKVAYKLRPLDDTGKLVLENNLAGIPQEVSGDNLRAHMTSLGGSSGYYSVTGVPGLTPGANVADYEQIIISPAEVIARL